MLNTACKRSNKNKAITKKRYDYGQSHPLSTSLLNGTRGYRVEYERILYYLHPFNFNFNDFLAFTFSLWKFAYLCINNSLFSSPAFSLLELLPSLPFL